MIALGTACFCCVSADAQENKPRRNIFRNPSVKTVPTQAQNTPNTDGATDSKKAADANPGEKNNISDENYSNDIEITPIASADGAGRVEVAADSEKRASDVPQIENNPNAPMQNWSERLKLLRAENEAKKPFEIYRAAAGDVLDIELNISPNASTLFTILDDGTLDYPLAGEILNVAGMTADEIALLLKEKIKGFDVSHLKVGIREFISHRLRVSGAVENGGEKTLRREAVPLYAVLAEAQVKSDAVRVQIQRGKQQTVYTINEAQSAEILIYPSDAITVLGSEENAANRKFYYIIGAVNQPGEKEFRPEMTLTQAVFAAGGATGKDTSISVVIMRQSSQGLIVTTEYNLKDIVQGKVTDPFIAAGDRIEIQH